MTRIIVFALTAIFFGASAVLMVTAPTPVHAGPCPGNPSC
jgi:hypothetical protein